VLADVNLEEITRGRYIMALDPNGDRLYLANHESHDIAVIDPEKAASDPENAQIATIPMGSPSSGIFVSPDGTRLYTLNFSSHAVSVIDAQKAESDPTNALISTIDLGQRYPDNLVLSPDGTRIYLSDVEADGMEPSLAVIDTKMAESHPEDAIIARMSLSGRAHNHYYLAIDPEGTRLYVGNPNTNDLTAINIQMVESDPENALAGTFSLQMPPSALTVSPDGHRLYVIHRGNNSLSVIAIPEY
jgi:YVTN family beta-propeller protein